jgi:hypothetical protein
MAIIRRKHLLLGIVAFVLVAAVVAWRVLRVSDLAHIGTGYTAQQTCACLFVGGRTLESCMTDLDPLARRLVSVHPGPDEVTATGLGLSTATARYERPTSTLAPSAPGRCAGSKSPSTKMPSRTCSPSMASAPSLRLPPAPPRSVNSSWPSGAEAEPCLRGGAAPTSATGVFPASFLLGASFFRAKPPASDCG